MNTGNKMTLINYIKWHFSTKLRALQGFLNPNTEIQKEIDRCNAALEDPEKESANWIIQEVKE